jgi:aspartate/methionine/tyrosine aminotransferase
MARLHDFTMERWQSIYENRVPFNLSESGVHPLTVRELLELGDDGSFGATLIGYGQSNGTDTLRARIAALYQNADAGNVVVANGSAEANFVALWHLIEPGDEAVVIRPTYMQSVGLIESLGGTVRSVWLREESGWQPDPDEINAAVNARTRVIVVTNPVNPTGSILEQAARAAITQAAERVGAWILADEVYTGAEIARAETPSFWRPDARVIATGSLSKAYGLPGLRIGWLVAPADVAERLWARKDYTTIGPGDLTDRLASMALDPRVRTQLLQRTRGFILAGLDVIEPWLKDTGVFHYRRPDAGAILWARYDVPVNSSELVERLRVEQGVLVVAGDHFGLDSYLRFGFGSHAHSLQAALARVSECLGAVAVR